MSLLDSLISISFEAGQAIMNCYRQPPVSTPKADRSPLTQADLESHHCIAGALKALTPEIPLVSEEGLLPSWETRQGWNAFWLVDPLDGTKEFIDKNGEFTVNIALIRNGSPEMAVVYAPALELFYFSQTGNGSWKKTGVNGRPEKIYSDPADPNGPVRIVESRSHPSKELEDYLKSLDVKERIRVGSSLKFCYVAESRADLYPRFGPTMEWDVAAGDCVFINSGRHGPRRSGLKYNKSDLRNPHFILGLS